MRRIIFIVAGILLVVSAAAPTVASASTSTGLFPGSGTPAYDVSSYRIKLRIDNRSRRFRGQVTVDAVAMREFRHLSLDAGTNLRILSVGRAGRKIRFRHRGTKLTLPIQRKLGQRWKVTIRYRGRIRELFDWTGAAYGWVRSGDHDWVTLSEPNVSRLWMPVNDTPADQATYRFALNVPHGYLGVANGSLVRSKRGPGRGHFIWKLDGEIPPYAALVASGRWKLFHSAGSGIWNVARKWSQLGALKRVARLRAFLERYLGPRPYFPGGGLAARGMPYALETATRPVYWNRPEGALVIHELAHDWFGNSVSLADWKNIWLNEGPATWFEWFWQQETGQRTIRNQITGPWCRYRNKWSFPTALPGPRDNIFSDIDVYWRGGLVMELLRRKVGTETFFAILQRWTSEKRFSSVTTSEFIALAENESGQDLSDVFDPYLFGKKAIWPEALMGFPHTCP